MIKYIIGSLVLALAIQATLAQNVARTGYFMDNSTHKHLMNPALVPSRGYFSIGLGSIDLDLQSNMGFTNFIFPGSTENDPLLTFMHDDVTSEQVLSQLSPENYFRINQRISLLSLGYYSGTTFWTFEVASRINAKMDIPYEFFAFMKQGMSSTAGNRYEINNLSLSANMMAEASLGSSLKITDDIRVGVKGKLLFGGAKIVGGIDQMIIDMKPDSWTVTTNGLINLYGGGLDFTTDEDGIVNSLAIKTPNMAGMGFALDIGASWNPLEFLEVSAGIVDLGSIVWNKTYSKVARSSGTITYEGFENIGMEEEEEGEGNSTEDQMKTLTDGLMEMAQFKPVNESEKLNEALAPTINLGVEADVLDDKVSLGLLYSNRLITNNNISEITGIVNYKPFSSLNLAASYSLINGVKKTFGLAVGANISIVNLFVACDYIPMFVTPQFIPLNDATTHLQIGVSLSLGKLKNKE